MNKSIAKERILAGFLAIYSVIGAVSFTVFKTIIPFPFAEIISFSYLYFKRGVLYVAIPILIMYFMAIVFMILAVNVKYCTNPIFIVTSVLILLMDAAIHIYAFLICDGYEWNYMICGILDAAAIFSLLIKREKKRT